MNRKLFLTIVAAVALGVGAFAVLGAGTLLSEVKGATPNEAALVMTREVGVLLLSVGLLTFLVRSHADSPTLAAILLSNGALQLAILPIEVLAHGQGSFSKLSGIVPNSVFHVLAAAGFFVFAARMKRADSA